MAIMVIFAIVANRKLKKAKEVPDGFQNIIELIVEMLDKMVEGTMGKWAPRFVNYISTIFIFILMSNISGLFGLRPPTSRPTEQHMALAKLISIFHDQIQ